MNVHTGRMREKEIDRQTDRQRLMLFIFYVLEQSLILKIGN